MKRLLILLIAGLLILPSFSDAMGAEKKKSLFSKPLTTKPPTTAANQELIKKLQKKNQKKAPKKNSKTKKPTSSAPKTIPTLTSPKMSK